MAISGSARTVTCGPAWLTASSLAAIVRMLPQSRARSPSDAHS